jgi:hypothetical protein
MATLVSRGADIRFTILPYSLDTPIQEELISHPSDYVLGYVTHTIETGERKFIYTESGGLTDVEDHWSLAILKEFPYIEQNGPWIVYNCSPEKAKSAFGKILSGESLHIDNWDIWSVKSKDAKVAVITAWEIY